MFLSHSEPLHLFPAAPPIRGGKGPREHFGLPRGMFLRAPAQQ